MEYPHKNSSKKEIVWIQKYNRFAPWVLSAVAGALLSLGWGADNGLAVFLFFSLCPLLLANQIAASNRAVQYLLGLCTISIFHLSSGLHLISDIEVWTVVIWLLANSALLSIPWAIFVLMQKRLNSPSSLLLLIFLWLSIEYFALRSGIPNPWFVLGNGLAGHPEWVQFYEFTGVLGGTAWLLLANCALFYILRATATTQHSFRAVILPAIVTLIGISFPGLLNKQSDEQTLSVDQALLINTRQQKGDLLKVTFNELLLECMNIPKDVKYIIWPESILEFALPAKTIDSSKIVRDVRKHLIQNTDRVFICGLLLKDDNKQFNTALIIGRDYLHVYEKRKLVPFTEYHPAMFSAIPIFQMSELKVSPGDQPSPITNSLSVNICYESLFGELISQTFSQSQGQAIALISNEVWTIGANDQLLKICALRAIENRKWILRATNNGIGAVIDADGRIKTAPSGTRAITPFATDLKLSHETTFYMIHGNFLGWIAVATLPIFLLLLLWENSNVELITSGFRRAARKPVSFD
jgi:apolipoprotein N-acyltransferase